MRARNYSGCYCDGPEPCPDCDHLRRTDRAAGEPDPVAFAVSILVLGAIGMGAMVAVACLADWLI